MKGKYEAVPLQPLSQPLARPSDDSDPLLATADADASLYISDTSLPSSPSRHNRSQSDVEFIFEEGVGGHVEQSLLKFASQVLPSLLLAGMGMLGAGILLDVVQASIRKTWHVPRRLTPLLRACSTGSCLCGFLRCSYSARRCWVSRATWR